MQKDPGGIKNVKVVVILNCLKLSECISLYLKNNFLKIKRQTETKKWGGKPCLLIILGETLDDAFRRLKN